MTCECLCQIPSDQLFYYDKTPHETCVICMEHVNERDRSVLKCGHEFHTSCLMSHVIKCSNKCPLCRDEISEKVEERPNLNTPMANSFITKNILSGINGFIPENMNNLIQSLGIDTSSLSQDQYRNVYTHLMKILLEFGTQTCTDIDNWIKQGNQRMNMVDYNDEQDIDVNDIVNRYNIIVSQQMEHHDVSELHQEFPFDDSIVNVINNNDMNNISETTEFLITNNLGQYTERIMMSEYLRNIDNLLSADVDTLMFPPSWNSLTPLLRRNEANIILGGILAYFCDFLDEPE